MAHLELVYWKKSPTRVLGGVRIHNKRNLYIQPYNINLVVLAPQFDSGPCAAGFRLSHSCASRRRAATLGRVGRGPPHDELPVRGSRYPPQTALPITGHPSRPR